MHTPDLGLPGLEDPVPPSWTTIEDDFVLIYVVKQVFPMQCVLASYWHANYIIDKPSKAIIDTKVFCLVLWR